jgi:8-oxo-dGTP pyrophosphatase MutT (NUDIX family)
MESAEQALIRELQEEVGHEFTIKRFLGCLEFSANPSHAKCHSHEYSFIFEVSSMEFKANQPITKLENHIELHWVSLNQLKEIDFKPEPLKVMITEWLEKDLSVAFRSQMV